MELDLLCDFAIEAALAGGKVIRKYMDQELVIHTKDGGHNYASQVVTVADKASETAILKVLDPIADRYDIAMLSEETEDDGLRHSKDYFWAIDPLDGTLAFINDHPGFSVSIALVARDGTPHIGVVYDPSTDSLYHAVKGIGAYKNRQPWIVKATNAYLSYYTDKRLADTPQADKISLQLAQLASDHQLSEIREISGAGAVLNAIQVLEHGPACLIKLPKKELGGGSIWDYAATSCIYQECRLPAQDYHGNRLALNRPDGHFMNEQGVYFANLTKT